MRNPGRDRFPSSRIQRMVLAALCILSLGSASAAETLTRGAAIAGPQFDRADVSQPAAAGSGCESPDRPPEGVSPERWQMFLDAVDAFRACIDHRVESHQQAAAFHSAAARRAVDEWNLFVRHSLNAPEDFPFPPQASDDREPADPRQQVISGNWDGRALKDQF